MGGNSLIPNQPFENFYNLPVKIAARIHGLAQAISLAMKATCRCDGILIRQHNEPAGGQHIGHYHLHILPRYENDDCSNSQKHPFPAEEKAEYAPRLRNWICSSE